MRIKYDMRIEYYEYNFIMRIHHIKDDKYDGEFKLWYNDGKLGLQCNYKNDNSIKTKFNLK